MKVAECFDADGLVDASRRFDLNGLATKTATAIKSHNVAGSVVSFGYLEPLLVEHVTMGRLIDGKWTDSDESYRQGGAFVRATPAFRSFITADRSSQFPAKQSAIIFM